MKDVTNVQPRIVVGIKNFLDSLYGINWMADPMLPNKDDLKQFGDRFGYQLVLKDKSVELALRHRGISSLVLDILDEFPTKPGSYPVSFDNSLLTKCPELFALIIPKITFKNSVSYLEEAIRAQREECEYLFDLKRTLKQLRSVESYWDSRPS